MKQDRRLSMVLHVLLHMEHLGGVLTSEALAPMLATNPVVVRRVFRGLREAGIVRAEKGHGGGWKLARPLAKVSLSDVYDALGSPPFFSVGHRNDAPTCLLEKAVNRTLDDSFDAARALLEERLRAVSVADIAKKVSTKMRKGHGSHG